MIEVTGKYVTSALAIWSDSLYVFDQWCIPHGQSGSREPWQLAKLFVNQNSPQTAPHEIL